MRIQIHFHIIAFTTHRISNDSLMIWAHTELARSMRVGDFAKVKRGRRRVKIISLSGLWETSSRKYSKCTFSLSPKLRQAARLSWSPFLISNAAAIEGERGRFSAYFRAYRRVCGNRSRFPLLRYGCALSASATSGPYGAHRGRCFVADAAAGGLGYNDKAADSYLVFPRVRQQRRSPVFGPIRSSPNVASSSLSF